jgi:hypothetical protein
MVAGDRDALDVPDIGRGLASLNTDARSRRGSQSLALGMCATILPRCCSGGGRRSSDVGPAWRRRKKERESGGGSEREVARVAGLAAWRLYSSGGALEAVPSSSLRRGTVLMCAVQTRKRT